jgi:hypothetical protein
VEQKENVMKKVAGTEALPAKGTGCGLFLQLIYCKGGIFFFFSFL